MSDRQKNMIVLEACNYAGCALPEAGEEAFDWIYNTYMEGFNYEKEGDFYAVEELAENQIPRNSYRVSTIWTELQLYSETFYGFKTYGNTEAPFDFIFIFQKMLYDVAESVIYVGRSAQNKKGIDA